MQKASGKRRMRWVNRLRLRLALIVVTILLAVFSAISVGPGWLALPLAGIAVAAVTMTLNRTAGRLSHRICLTCGGDLRGTASGEYGLICPDCGSVNQPGPRIDDGARAKRNAGMAKNRAIPPNA